MKEIFNKIAKKLDKVTAKQKQKKDKYYWKRKYYRLLRDVNNERKINEQLSTDLRIMYSNVKKYQRRIKEYNQKNRERSNYEFWIK